MNSIFKQVNIQEKSLYHIDRIFDIKNKKFVAPVTIELDLSTICNMDCKYWCYWNKLRKNNKDILDKKNVYKVLKEAKDIGIKGIVFSGGGEPTCNPDFKDILLKSHFLGLQNGLFSNALLLDKHTTDIVLATCEWARFSLSAATEETFKKMQGISGIDKIHNNLIYFFNKLHELKEKMSAGICFMVVKQNAHEIYDAALIAKKKLHSRYIQLKPCSNIEPDKEWWTKDVVPQFKKALKLKDKNFDVFSSQYSISLFIDDNTKLISNAFPRLPFLSNKCYISYLTLAITAGGDVCFCKHFRDNPKMAIGNIKKQSLKEIFSSYKYKEMHEKINRDNCGIKQCQYSNANDLLAYIISPSEDSHPNFL